MVYIECRESTSEQVNATTQVTLNTQITPLLLTSFKVKLKGQMNMIWFNKGVSMQEFDVFILGGGPGGYVAAIRASRLVCVWVWQKGKSWRCLPKLGLYTNKIFIKSLVCSKF